MTIEEAIELLKVIQAKHGPDVSIYFDCPNCRQSFTPGKVDVKAVILTKH